MVHIDYKMDSGRDLVMIQQ